MTRKEPKASKPAFGLTNSEYKLLCGVIVYGKKIEYDLPSVTAYLGSTSSISIKNRIGTLFGKIRRDAYNIADERGVNANGAIQDTAAALVPVSNTNPRKRAQEDNEYGNDNHNVSKRHNSSFSSCSSSAQISKLRSREQQYDRQQQSQQPHRYQQAHHTPIATHTRDTHTRDPRGFLAPAQNQRHETPPPAYARLPVITSNNAVNQGVGVDTGMGFLSEAQTFGSRFGHGLDGNGFPLGINQVGNGLTFGAPTGPASLAYPSGARNGFGLPNNNGVNDVSHNCVNRGAMGFAFHNDLDYRFSMDSRTFYDHNLHLRDDLMGTTDNDFANSFNGSSGNAINGPAMEYGLQNNFANPPVNHITGSNSNSVPQNVHIATVPRPVQPVFQSVFQPAQTRSHQDTNLNFDFIGKNGNVNGNTTAVAQWNGVQPEVAIPISEQQPVAIPAAQHTPARLPTPAPTPADAAGAYTAILQQQDQSQQDELQQDELQQDQHQQDRYQQELHQQQQPPQGELDPWDALFHQEQEQLPQEGFESLEAQLFSAMTAEGYGLDLPDL
ncbi:hypothetical protein QBC45DRAFT_374851 [Copromyces sp. CBS 386.78]|nr:hypothetical protein QBC45DRAFT_374851 [Copromyces sp. CBS 386.78]